MTERLILKPEISFSLVLVCSKQPMYLKGLWLKVCYSGQPISTVCRCMFVLLFVCLFNLKTPSF